jgi:hypothetical protein
METRRRWTGVRRFVAVVAASAVLSLAATSITAAEDASYLPSMWHIHDGQGATLGPQHKSVGFFPTILGISTADYLLDPARCPNATDKAFLPSVGSAQSPLLRAGVCMTSSAVIELRTVPAGTAGPAGWSILSGTDGGAWDTYYRVTST